MLFPTIFLGLICGAVVTASTFLASWVAERLAPARSLLDVIIRMGLLVGILFPLAGLLGEHFAAQVRGYPTAFLIAFVLGYLIPAWGRYTLRNRERH